MAIKSWVWEDKKINTHLDHLHLYFSIFKMMSNSSRNVILRNSKCSIYNLSQTRSSRLGCVRWKSTSSSSNPSSTNSISYLVQSTDYSSYLAHYFYQRRHQQHYLAIRAFNSELASIKDSVSSEILGRIRIGWWRDAIAGAYDVSSNDVAEMEKNGMKI